jgi:hypothetical protein
MSEKSKELKKRQKEHLKLKWQYEKERKQTREILCDSCTKVSSCKRAKGVRSCKLYVKGDEDNGMDNQSTTHLSSEVDTEAA